MTNRRREAPPSGYARGFDPSVSDEAIELLAGEAPPATTQAEEPSGFESATVEKAEALAAPESFEGEVVQGTTTLAPIKFDVTKAQLTELVSKIGDVTFDTPANYERGRLAIANLRSLRVGVEKVARSLKDGANDYKKQVDKHGNELIAIISEPEDRLCAAKKLVDDEKARVKAEKEAAEKARIEAELRAKREEEERVLREAREAEERRLAEERAALELERQRLAEQQRQAEEAARLERERVAAAQRAEQARLDAERAEIEAERARAAEAQRLADEAAQAERDRREAEAQAARDAADAAAREQRERAEAEAREAREREEKVAREAREAEQARLDAERQELERQRAELKAAQEASAKAEEARLAAIQAKADEDARLERERVAAEEARVAEAARAEAERARLEALQPDRERLRMVAGKIRALTEKPPTFTTPEGGEACAAAFNALERVAVELEAFGQTQGAEAAE